MLWQWKKRKWENVFEQKIGECYKRHSLNFDVMSYAIFMRIILQVLFKNNEIFWENFENCVKLKGKNEFET